MQTWVRYLLLVFGMLIILHSILRFSHEDYSRATSLSNIINGNTDKSVTASNDNDHYFPQADTNATLAVDRRANATFVILARNTDIEGTIRSLRDIEDRFNRRRGYPYVFLNDEPFTDEFKRRVSVLSASLMEFGQVPKEHWVQPSSIDETKAAEARQKMVDENIIYGGSVSPEVHFHCELGLDPFLFMEENNKVYGWTITMYEYEKTIPTLWGHVKDFMGLHPEFIAEDNALGFMSRDGGNHYNLCHFWSNFEIADMEFWRGPAYTAFFEYLDSQGGFYYERWGDAPVHSIAAAMFLNKNQLHFFDEIGYEHSPYTHCPQKVETWERGRCSCNMARSFATLPAGVSSSSTIMKARVLRYCLLVLSSLIFLYFLRSIVAEVWDLKLPTTRPERVIPAWNTTARANATFVILARNSDIEGTFKSVRDIELRFNVHRGYPYVFLNEEPFLDEFKQRVSALSGSQMEFGIIPTEHWVQPEWVDEDRAREGREKMEQDKVVYGALTIVEGIETCVDSTQGLFFFKHDLMQKYRWYWRIEPNVDFLCDITVDPFTFMRDKNKIYGFTMSLFEFEKTVHSLWGHVREFMRLYPEYIAPDNAMGFLSNDDGETYNLCHFWSNFEIADMNFWRGPAYTAFFEHLDATGGFYYEITMHTRALNIGIA
ncbi:hypothetical protein H0H81_002034 [Sphagnurus paluster]|uniref:Uncharacterized protein n=1 Tax=Sphagnurus paluster TaxID=117069 RepID=A0A9P7K4M2_9AGAR|nr:hypothetical protein H0H81_002034 [Sphagnurus paluster]